jgi:TonB-dependent SusC/RagA subfamily outer membrane receptor
MNWKIIITGIVAVALLQVAAGQKSDKKSDKPITITGNVMNQDQRAVVGAVLYIDNIRTENITQSDGSYKIKVSPSALKLKVKSSEFGSCETIINGHTLINFTLDGADGVASLLDDNEKGIGPTDAEKKSSRSKGKKMNTYTNIYQMIRGECSGVVVSGNSVQIQQGKSFFGSSDPLFVVNGVIVNSIDNINPVEVKSIAVLKGSQAAIYGVRGSNGVISITLINGSEKEK